MSQPDFLNSSVTPYYHGSDIGVTDVNTIISSVRTALVTNLSWTEPSTALFTSPVVDGMFFDVLLTRISATVLETRFRDYRGQVLRDGSIEIDAGGDTVNYYCTKYSAVIESMRATAELSMGFLTDLTPNADVSACNKFVATTFRNSSQTADVTESVGQFFAFDNGTATNDAQRFPILGVNSANAAVIEETNAGTVLWRDALVMIKQGATQRWSGRLPQALLTDQNYAAGTEKSVPIDNAVGTTAVFHVLNQAVQSSGRGMLALRKSG